MRVIHGWFSCWHVGGGDTGAGRAVGTQIDETDLSERRLADDVRRPAVLPAVDHDLLVFFDELELFDTGADRGLPRKAVLGTDDHFASGRRIA